MARYRHGDSAPVVKKGGFLGKFVAFLLGFILGIGAIAGAVAGIVVYVMSNTLSATAGLMEGFMPGIYSMMFGADGQNNGLLDEKYAEKTVAELLGDSMTAITEIQSGNGSLQSLGNVFPIVGNFAAQICVEMDAYAIPVDHATLMSKPLGEVKDYLMESAKNAALGDLLKSMDSDNGKGNKLMNAISYGEENVDYTFDENGNVVMLNGAKKTTLNDLISEDGMDGLINKLPLDAVMDVNMSDEVMCAIAYGSTSRYSTNDKGDVIMNQVAYTFEDKGDGWNFYDDKSNAVDGTYELLTPTTAKLTLASGEVQYLKVEANNLTCKAYADEAFTKEVLYKKTKVGDLSKDSMSIINNIYLKDALGVDENSHKVLISLAYGKEGIDFEYSKTDGSIQLIGNAKPRTIGDLRERGGALIDEIPLTDITVEDRENGLVMYILYGREGVHYQIDKTTDKVVMLQKHIAIVQNGTETKVYNEYGELLSGYSINTASNLYVDADGNEYTYVASSHEGAIQTLETNDGEIANVYYLSNANGPVPFTATLQAATTFSPTSPPVSP